MNRQHGGVAALLAAIALTGCAPAVVASTSEPISVSAEDVAAVDGDTVDVATEGGTIRVRLIGLIPRRSTRGRG